MLLRADIFKLIGKVMVHSLVHTGVAFIGLSQAVAEYLCIDKVDYTTPIKIDNSDLSDFEVQNAVEKVFEDVPKIT